MNVTRRPRAIAALAMLLAMGITTFEPVAGEVRDATEHYGGLRTADESDESAAVNVAVDGESPDAQHIKGFDHCNHTHGCAVRAAPLSPAAEHLIPERERPTVVRRPPEAPPASLYRPPRV